MGIYRANPLDLNGFITRGATLTFPQKCPKHLANSSTLMAFWGEVSRPSPTQQLGAMGPSPWIPPKKTDWFRFESVRNKRPKNPKQKSKIPTKSQQWLEKSFRFFSLGIFSDVRSRGKRICNWKSPVNAPPVSQKNQSIKVSKLSDQQRATRNTQHLPVLIFSPHDNWHSSLALSHHKQLTTMPLQRNILKVPGKVTPCKLVTSCKFWLRLLPNVKLCRLFGKVT